MAAKTPRGILVARIVAAGKQVHLIEIARRPRTKKTKDGKLTESEESFKGFVFVLNDPQELRTALGRILSDIRYVHGIVQNLDVSDAGMGAAFVHPPAKSGEIHGQAALINALKKAGVTI